MLDTVCRVNSHTLCLASRLVNTGWTAGGYGVGYRMKLKHTRAIIDAIHSGELAGADCSATPIFGLQVGRR